MTEWVKTHVRSSPAYPLTSCGHHPTKVRLLLDFVGQFIRSDYRLAPEDVRDLEIKVTATTRIKEDH